MNVIITGSTGMLGKGVLIECLDHPEIASVLVINRRSIGFSHPKLQEVIHADFSDLSAIQEQLKGFDTCFFCLGITSVGISDEDYHRITFDLTINFAKMALNLNPEMTFCFISGAGTDSSEKGSLNWARVKGKTENALLAMPFKAAYMFRPGFIQPMKGIRSRFKTYTVVFFLLRPFYPLLKKLPKYVSNTTQVGQAMINVALRGYSKKILESIDINQAAGV